MAGPAPRRPDVPVVTIVRYAVVVSFDEACLLTYRISDEFFGRHGASSARDSSGVTLDWPQ